MKSYSKLSVLFVFICLLSSCSKDDSSDGDDSQNGYDYQSLNGTWSGDTRILQAGGCASGDPNWNLVELFVDVDDNGNVAISTERQFDTQDNTWHVSTGTQWSGKIKTNDSIFLTKTFIVDCFGTDVAGSSEYASRLIRNGSIIKLNLNAVEIFCPDQNCVFDRSYRLTL